MINEASILALYSETVKKVTQKYKPLICPIPRQQNIDLIFGEIKRYKEVTRKVLIRKSGVSRTCLHNVLNFLLDNKKITRKLIGNAGAHNVYSYSAVELV